MKNKKVNSGCFKPKGKVGRHRNIIMNFHASPEEKARIDARITISCIPRVEFYLKSILGCKITVVSGKYKSDRLAVEMKKLRRSVEEISIEPADNDEDIYYLLLSINALMQELIILLENNPDAVDLDKYRKFVELRKKGMSLNLKNIPE